ncbi:hypothetical protein QBC43DRAFT_352110 [Cladorrhinum sp. PSN259]|nr:hypothetical protein QBC43DRAFT_352110 [Cladorrhinum sp. PSN259]
MLFPRAISLTLLSILTNLALAAPGPTAENEAPTLAHPIPFVDASSALIDDADASSGNLTKRACDYNGCKCNSRGRQLTVCGNCVWDDTEAFVVTKKRKLTHIFECSKSGDCCSYGYAKDCGGSSARCKINS